MMWIHLHPFYRSLQKRQDGTEGLAENRADVGGVSGGGLLGGLLGRDRGGLTINLGGLTRGLSPLASGALGLASGVAGGVKDGLVGLGSGLINGSGSKRSIFCRTKCDGVWNENKREGIFCERKAG